MQKVSKLAQLAQMDKIHQQAKLGQMILVIKQAKKNETQKILDKLAELTHFPLNYALVSCVPSKSFVCLCAANHADFSFISFNTMF